MTESSHSQNQLIHGEFPVTLQGCCLLCDQIELSVDPNVLDPNVLDPNAGNSHLQVANACAVCESDVRTFFDREVLPEPADVLDVQSQVAAASKILGESNLPLICGLTDQSIETQVAAVRLAKRCNAAIDWTFCNSIGSNSIGNWPFAFQHALQDTGWVSCSFGEIAERADLVIEWSCDTEQSHPAFARRFIGEVERLNIDWDRKRQVSALRFLRDAAWTVESPCDAEFGRLQEKINAAKYPVIIVDDSISQTLGDAGVLSLFRFVRQQNDRNHCRLVHLSGQQNDAGIRSTLASMAGGPFGVTYRDGKPKFRGREFSVELLLERNLVDTLVLIGTADQLPGCWHSSESLKTIWICDGPSSAIDADVLIPTARWGLSCTGTGTRDDGLTVSRPALFKTELNEPAKVLERILV